MSEDARFEESDKTINAYRGAFHDIERRFRQVAYPAIIQQIEKEKIESPHASKFKLTFLMENADEAIAFAEACRALATEKPFQSILRLQKASSSLSYDEKRKAETDFDAELRKAKEFHEKYIDEMTAQDTDKMTINKRLVDSEEIAKIIADFTTAAIHLKNAGSEEGLARVVQEYLDSTREMPQFNQEEIANFQKSRNNEQKLSLQSALKIG